MSKQGRRGVRRNVDGLAVNRAKTTRERHERHHDNKSVTRANTAKMGLSNVPAREWARRVRIRHRFAWTLRRPRVAKFMKTLDMHAALPLRGPSLLAPVRLSTPNQRATERERAQRTTAATTRARHAGLQKLRHGTSEETTWGACMQVSVRRCWRCQRSPRGLIVDFGCPRHRPSHKPLTHQGKVPLACPSPRSLLYLDAQFQHCSATAA